MRKIFFNRKSKTTSVSRMAKTLIVWFLTVLSVTSVASVEAQQKKSARIGFLFATTRAGSVHHIDAFVRGLHELGYVEGQNISIEYRFAEGRFDLLPVLAAELVRLKVDVILTMVTQASLEVKKATSTIPIVFVAVSDPVAAGLVPSLAQPGGNITGTSAMSADLIGKQLELLKETIPKLSRVAALWNPANPVYQAMQLKETEAGARALRMQVQTVEARDIEEIERAFAIIARRNAKALLVLGDPVFTTHRRKIAAMAIKHRLPTVSGVSEYTEAGLMMTYGPNFPESCRRAAAYVDRILKGAKPGDLPIERPTKFELVVNLKTAKEISLTIPPNVLARADRVIK